MTTVLKIICLIALAMVGCGTFELLQYGKAIQEETQIRLQSKAMALPVSMVTGKRE